MTLHTPRSSFVIAAGGWPSMAVTRTAFAFGAQNLKVTFRSADTSGVRKVGDSCRAHDGAAEQEEARQRRRDEAHGMVIVVLVEVGWS